jgi:hypothetical protein
MPMMRSALPDVAPVKPLVPAKTLYYRKEAAKPAPPAPVALPINYQDPATIAQAPTVPQLPSGAMRITPPGISDINLLSDADLKQVVVREADQQYQQRDNIYKTFPTTYYEHEGTKRAFAPRVFAPATMRVEANYLCYDRLYFEDKNSERYGWELGPLQPFVSAAKFYADLLSLPYNVGTRPCQRFETNAGYCLPGDPVPYLIYPVELSVTGGLLQAGTVVGLYAIFP